MNKHVSIDNLSVKLGSFYGEKFRFFRDGLDSEKLTKIPEAVDLDFTGPVREGEYHIPVRYGRLEAVSRYSLLNWAGDKAPTLIFHHGSGETNYVSRIKKIFPKSRCGNLNILALSIPWNLNLREYLYGIGSLNRFSFLLASSARLTESLIGWLRQEGAGAVVVSGISLGGWVTNLHHALYNSADEYRPIFAGAALDHLFNETVYQTMVALPFREEKTKISEILNFEKLFSTRDSGNVYPLLARYDQYIRFERQAGIYRSENLNVLDKGHVTGAMDIKALRSHLLGGDHIE